tara:strand:- start:1163 stop:1654 length:492 start_codon:yes stop_codon:yes gene_type:complete
MNNKSKNTITEKSNQELISEKSLSIIEEKLVKGMTLSEILSEEVNNKPLYPFSLMKFYNFLKKNPESEARIIEARKLGVQTLIDKLLNIFNHQEIENPNQILWVREKTRFIQWIAGKITDLYSDNKVQQVKQDTSLNISWSDGGNIKEIEGIVDEIEQQPPKD